MIEDDDEQEGGCGRGIVIGGIIAVALWALIFWAIA